MQVRPPQVAGMFYPADPAALRNTIAAVMAEAPSSAGRPKAIIAPHAGYVYSAAIAAHAYGAIRARAAEIRRVVLLGPAHRLAFRGIAAPAVDALRTPLGDVPVDKTALAGCLGLPEVTVLEAAFDQEHGLEVHLPFLQCLLERFAVVPFVVGAASVAAVERLLATLWGGPETLIVISSDLSHFLSYDAARACDRETCAAIETLALERLDGSRACGFLPVSGLLARARTLDLRLTTLDYRNSGDTAGGRDRVVGYGAFAAEYAHAARLAPEERAELHRIAREAIRLGAVDGRPWTPELAGLPPALRAHRAAFVTLKLDGQLRGCVGSLVPLRPLAVDVACRAFEAAFCDPRFAPVTAAEVARLTIGISVLSHWRPLAAATEVELAARLRPDLDGLMMAQTVAQGEHRAVFLPSVWAEIRDPLLFIRHLKVKAGLPAEHWSPSLKAWHCVTESF